MIYLVDLPFGFFLMLFLDNNKHLLVSYKGNNYKVRKNVFKKILTLMATVAMLTVCSENEAANNNQDALQTKENPVVQQENEQSKDYIQEDAKENVNQSQWTSLPEYNGIIGKIGNEDVTFEMETDNEGKRVLNILEQDGSILY